MAEYLSITEFCAKYGKDRSNVNRLIHAGRIPAVRIGSQWAIPFDAVPPPDGRVKSGQYTGWRKRKEPAEER